MQVNGEINEAPVELFEIDRSVASTSDFWNKRHFRKNDNPLPIRKRSRIDVSFQSVFVRSSAKGAVLIGFTLTAASDFHSMWIAPETLVVAKILVIRNGKFRNNRSGSLP